MTTRNTSSTIANIFHVSSDANTGNNNIDSDALEMALRRMKIISARQLLVNITPAILWRDSNDLRTKLLILHILQIAAGVSDAEVLTTRRLFASECNGLLDRDTQILVHQNVVAMTDTLRKQIAWDLDCVAAVRQRGQEILAFSGSSMQPAQRQQLFDAMLETALDAANSNISSQAPVAFDRSAPFFTGTDNISSMGPNRHAPCQGQPQGQPQGPDHGKSFMPSQQTRQLSSLLESGQSFQLLGSLSTHPNSQGLLHFLSTSNGNNYSPSTHNNIGLSDICNPNESTPTTIDASNQSSLNLFLSQIQERHLQPQLNGNLPFAMADSGQILNQARQNEHRTELGQLRNLYSILQSSPALVLDILRAESNSNLSLGSTVDLQFQLQQHLSGQVQMQEGRFRSGSEQSLRLPQQLLQELLVGKRAVERNSNLGDEEVSSNHGGGEVGVPRREQGQSQEEGRGSTDGGANHLQRQDYEDLDEEEDISDEEGASTNVPMQVVENTKDHASRWRRRYEELLQYRAEFGDCLVPQRYERNPKLGTWVRTQRRHYKLMSDGKQSSMRMDRLRKLSDIGFVWSVR